MIEKQKVLIRNSLSVGDIVMLTAAVRDLHKAYPERFETQVQTSCCEIWENNPLVSAVPFDDNDKVKIIEANYPLINYSNQRPVHFIYGFAEDLAEQLRIPKFPITEFKGDIYLSEQEKNWCSQVEEMDKDKNRFWLVNAGGKWDFTAKWWNPNSYQKVVDHFKGRITFVQVGERNHFHQPLKNVINLIGKTDLRQLIRLVYHSSGILCPVTGLMHLAAAVPCKQFNKGDGWQRLNEQNLKNRPAVIVAGGREPAQWEQYPHHRFLSVNGCLPCCAEGGCWKSRCQLVHDGDKKDSDRCLLPVQVSPSLQIAKCMEMIRPEQVITAIESYYEGGMLMYDNQYAGGPHDALQHQ